MTLKRFKEECEPLGLSLSDLPHDAFIYSKETGEVEEIIDAFIPKGFYF